MNRSWFGRMRRLFDPRRWPAGHWSSSSKPRRPVLALEQLEARWVPTTYMVENTSNSAGMMGSLPYELNLANGQTSGTALINFDTTQPVFKSASTITLAGTLTLSDTSVTLTTISGPSAGVTISGNNSFTVFTVNGSVTATLSGLTIVNGNGFEGGGIDNAGTLTVSGSTLSNDSATTFGGGLLNDGNCTVSGSTLSNDSATYGGGIYSNNGTLTVSGSTLSGNSATYDGGGIDNGSTLTVSGSTLNSDSARYGGGVYTDGMATLIDCTLSGNSAGAPVSGGGGVYNEGAFGNTTLTLTACTLSGSPLANAGIDGSSSITLADTILANSPIQSNYNNGGTATITSLGHNLSTDNGGGYLDAPGDQINTNPLLAPLGNYGGPTQTLALLPSSPGINTGDPTLGGTDQRGVPRSSVSPSIGAFQYQSTLVVNTTDDTPGADTPGLLTLRQAVNLADADTTTTSQPITFDTTSAIHVFASAQTITLNSGTLVLGGSTTVAPITITGPSAGVTISGADSYTVFQVNSSVTATLSGLTITDGNAQNPNDGGGISNAGTLTVSGSTLSNDSATNNGGGLYNTGSCTVSGSMLNNDSALYDDGGGISNVGTLTVNGSTLNNDSAIYESGGGIYNYGTASVSLCTLSNDFTLYGGGGGGILNDGTLMVSGSTFSNDSVSMSGGGDGGAIENVHYSCTLTTCTLNDNFAIYGGGIYNGNGLVMLTACTLSGNSASEEGGGIYNEGAVGNATVTLTACTLSGSSITNTGIDGSSSITLADTILANSPIDLNDNNGGAANITSLGHNLSTDNGGGYLTASGDQINITNPLLAPLGNYGGPTQTLALLPGSPALDSGSNALVSGLTTDQRGAGFPRIVNGTVDIGAFESSGFTLSLQSGSGQSANTNTAFAMPLTVKVTANNSLEPVNGGIITFTAPSSGPSATLSAGSATISSGLGAVSVGLGSVSATANGSVGSYDVLASCRGAAGAASFALTNTSALPTITGVYQINQGAVQRSMVTSITLTLSNPTTANEIPALLAELQLKQVGTGLVIGLAGTLDSTGKYLTLTFTGSSIVGGSLADGRYTLTYNSTTLLTSTQLFRLFGDLTGQGEVTAADEAVLVADLNSHTYNAALDYYGLGVLNGLDTAELLLRLNKMLNSSGAVVPI